MDELYDIVEGQLRHLNIPRTIEPREGDRVHLDFPFTDWIYYRESFISRLLEKLEDTFQRYSFTEYHDIKIIENGSHSTIDISQGVL
jgi:hypothetical protein